MSGFGPDPWTAKGITSAGERQGKEKSVHFLVVQRQGAHVTELGRYDSKAVARAALEEMVAKGFPRGELDVRRVKA